MLRRILLAFILLPASAGADPLLSLMAGEFSLQSGDNARAAGHYFDAALATSDPALAERASRIALLAEDTALAERAAERWRQLDPKSEGLLQLQALLSLARSDIDAAVTALSGLLELGSSGSRLAVQALANDLYALQAGLAIRGLVQSDALPDEADVWIGLGLIARRHQQSALSLDLANRATSRFPEDLRMRLWLAEEQLRLGSNDAAREALDLVLAEGELDLPLRMNAAALLERLGDSARAAELLAQGPQDENVIGTRAALLARQDEPQGLDALYDEAKLLEGSPDASRLLLLGQLAELVERDAEAMAWYRDVREEPQRGRAQLRIAVLLEREGDFEAAQLALHELQLEHEADGENVRDAYLLEAELLLRRQRDAEALEAYRRGLEIFENDPRLLYGRALVLERLNRVDEAIADLSSLLEQDPENPDHQNALGYTLVDRTDRLDEGLALIEQALEQRSDSAAVLDSHGWALYRLGRLDEALATLRRAFALQPDPEIAAHLGEVLWKLRQTEEAEAIWKQGTEMDPENRVLNRTIQRLDK